MNEENERERERERESMSNLGMRTSQRTQKPDSKWGERMMKYTNTLIYNCIRIKRNT
jgi:hypothetical protein